MFEMLKEDHRKVMKLMQDVVGREGAHGCETGQVKEIVNELRLHMAIEEEVLYPACEEKQELKDLVKDAYQEHSEAKEILIRLDGHTIEGKADCKEMVSKLLEVIQHHVQEEEGQFFPKAEKLFSQDELKRCMDEMASIKRSGLSYIEAR